MGRTRGQGFLWKMSRGLYILIKILVTPRRAGMSKFSSAHEAYFSSHYSWGARVLRGFESQRGSRVRASGAATLTINSRVNHRRLLAYLWLELGVCLVVVTLAIIPRNIGHAVCRTSLSLFSIDVETIAASVCAFPYVPKCVYIVSNVNEAATCQRNPRARVFPHELQHSSVLEMQRICDARADDAGARRSFQRAARLGQCLRQTPPAIGTGVDWGCRTFIKRWSSPPASSITTKRESEHAAS